MPIRRGSRCVPPAPGTTPSVTSGKPRTAPGAATRARQARAISKPPPSAAPLMAATAGRRIRRATTSGRCGSIGGRSNSFASAPAMKARPEPVTMSWSIWRAANAASARRQAAIRPSRTAREMTLTGGLSMVTTSARPCIWQRTGVSVIACTPCGVTVRSPAGGTVAATGAHYSSFKNSANGGAVLSRGVADRLRPATDGDYFSEARQIFR